MKQSSIILSLAFFLFLNFPAIAQWNSPVTPDATGTTGLNTSMAIVSGTPAIAYRNNSSNELRYVRANDATGTSWGTPIIVDNTRTPHTPSLNMVNGVPAIAYSNYYNKDLMFVRALNSTGTSWDTPITVDAAGKVGRYASLQIVNGFPAIAYFDWTNWDIKYVRASHA